MCVYVCVVRVCAGWKGAGEGRFVLAGKQELCVQAVVSLVGEVDRAWRMM
jgi:hypothetical protein